MAWTDDKDLGPWDFTEQPNKWGYLNNPRWSSQQDAIDFCNDHRLPLDLSDQHFPCGHWHKTAGDVVILREPIAAGRWVAAMQQPGTPYIYLYDITLKAVIKLDTSVIPVVLREVLLIEAAYNLDYDRLWYGVPGVQRGGYCMNKDGTRIWYLFRHHALGSTGNCELIEVDISGETMSKVGSMVYPNLTYFDFSYPEFINDGCSNDTYTYWCTEELTGRIIKIRNSDYSIVEDHAFNYTDANEPIHTLDVDRGNNKLYWTYCIDKVDYNACQKLTRSNLSFSVDIDIETCGLGAATPWWQNMIRIISGHIMHHRAYYPVVGNLYKRSLSYTEEAVSPQCYIVNILGVYGSNLFILRHDNIAVDMNFHLRCLSFSDLSQVGEREVNYYCGYHYPYGYDWEGTATSALNEQTGKIIIVRYPITEEKNYVACFDASSSFDLISDEPIDHIERIIRGEGDQMILDEPQVWTMPG